MHNGPLTDKIGALRQNNKHMTGMVNTSFTFVFTVDNTYADLHNRRPSSIDGDHP